MARSRLAAALLGLSLCTATAALGTGSVLLVRASAAPDNQRPTATVSAAPAYASPPAGVGVDGGISVGFNNTATVDFYFDYGCPECFAKEQPLLDAARDMQRAGFANITYHPMVTLDTVRIGSDYSSRLAGAAYCVVNHTPDAFTAFHDALVALKPANYRPGLTNPQLFQLAKRAGAGPEVDTCITSDTYEPYAAQMTARALEGEIDSVPGLLVGGEPVPAHLRTPKGVRAFILYKDGVITEDRLPAAPEGGGSQTANTKPPEGSLRP